MKKWIAVLFAMLTIGIAPAAFAGRLATLSVIDQNTGERLKIWRHAGRHYVAGNPGARYAVDIRNRTGARLLSVVSVDGVNVVSGATAATGQPGYVLNAGQSLEIKGWRKSMDEVAAFYFTRLPDSYAARTGRAANVGVIGVALFQEYVEPVIMRDEARSREAAPSSMHGGLAKQAEKSADAPLGTGHGERLNSAARTTAFRRASTQAGEIISIYYDTYAHLVARGVIPRSHKAASLPVPFPGNFVPDPS